MDEIIEMYKEILARNIESCAVLVHDAKRMSLASEKDVQSFRSHLAYIMRMTKPARSAENVKLNMNWNVSFTLSSLKINNVQTAVYNRFTHNIYINRDFWKNSDSEERLELIIHKLVHTVQHAYGELYTLDNEAEAYAISEYLVDISKLSSQELQKKFVDRCKAGTEPVFNFELVQDISLTELLESWAK